MTGSWEDPWDNLRDGIDKLKLFAAKETDGQKKVALEIKINELEQRAANYRTWIDSRKEGNQNG